MNRSLPKGKNKKVTDAMKDELGGLRTKTYSYLTENIDEEKRVKDTKKCVIKRKLTFEDYKNSL